MHYRSVSDLNRVITRNLHLIPQDVDLVVGIPRSGILPAIVIALMRNLRYADLDSFLEGRLAGAGSTKRHAGLIEEPAGARHVLVIDDSVNRGDAMREARARLGAMAGGTRITYAAVYVVPDAKAQVDVAFEVVPLPRVFEWNLAHHVCLEHACMDIDGVLCHDLLEDEHQVGPDYARALAEAVPLHRPTRRIGCLDTARPEKYRPQTEAWLEGQGIAYDRLVMRDGAAADEAFAPELQGEFKGRVFRGSDAILFISGDHSQAVEIARVAGKPVLSLQNQEMIEPDTHSGIAAIQRLRSLGLRASLSDSPLVSRDALKRRLQRVLPEEVYAVVHAVGARASKLLGPERGSAGPAAGPAAGLNGQGRVEPAAFPNGLAPPGADNLRLPCAASPSAGQFSGAAHTLKARTRISPLPPR